MSRKQSPEEKYAEAVAKKIGTTQRRVLNLFRSALSEASLLAQQVDFKPDKPFTFDDYPLTKKRSDKLINDLQKQILSTVSASVAYTWDLAEKKNDELVKSVLGSQAVPHRRTEGVKAFTARREQGLSLSDRVWKYTDQFKEELEMSLDLGLRDGLDAPAMSRAVREYLAEPNKLFRRVRDEHGHLHLSSRSKAYHPGQGVYRSSYKNALRLTATETNMAYRTADYERIQELDFVRGIEVCLSNNHTLNGKPFHCICDEFAGKYPKDFKFVGWHPLCRCYVKTILSDDPFMPEDTPEVTDIPQGLKDWVENNGNRIDRAFDKGRTAYWLRDNAERLQLHQPYKVLGFELEHKYEGGGVVLVHRDAEVKKSDYKVLLGLAQIFAQQGKVVQIPPRLHRDNPLYNKIYRTKGTKYYGKCPDLIIEGKCYEYEGYKPPWNKRKLASQLKHGLRQSNRIIIDMRGSGLSPHYVQQRLRMRIEHGSDVVEVLGLTDEGVLSIYIKRQRE
jgi:hypothetical protein